MRSKMCDVRCSYELTDEMRAKIHEEAIRKEAEYEK